MEEKRKVSAQVIGANIRSESGYRLPDLETFFEIALYYGASLEEFMKEAED